jgi:hypothetical protein
MRELLVRRRDIGRPDEAALPGHLASVQKIMLFDGRGQDSSELSKKHDRLWLCTTHD